MKTPLSIIVAAYQVQNFIEECLDSIENQSYFLDNDNFEVLVGIDYCQDTLSKLQEIRYKYRNLRIFLMDENKGLHVTINTLLDLAKYENILKFDSDDIMKPEMLEEIMQHADNYDLIRYGFNTFYEREPNVFKINEDFHLAGGTMFYKRKFFEIAGGYSDWRCAGDSELLQRMHGVIKEKIIRFFPLKKRLFLRRQHKKSLTKCAEYGYNSKIRMEYKKLLRVYPPGENPKIEKIKNTYTEIL